MNSGLEAKLVTDSIPKRISADIVHEILRAVADIEYGSVEIVIHDGKVVQIEGREKIRVNQSGATGRKTSKP